MKLGMTDVGELLLVLTGRKEAAGPPPREGQKVGPGLFHENAAGNTVLRFSKFNDGFYIAMSCKRDKETIQIKHAISASEAIVLEQLLKHFVVKYHGW